MEGRDKPSKISGEWDRNIKRIEQQRKDQFLTDLYNLVAQDEEQKERRFGKTNSTFMMAAALASLSKEDQNIEFKTNKGEQKLLDSMMCMLDQVKESFESLSVNTDKKEIKAKNIHGANIKIKFETDQDPVAQLEGLLNKLQVEE